MKKSISLFRDATIKGCAIVLSFSASVMLLQGCASMDPAAMLNSVGNPAMLANMDLGFTISGAPSDTVERAIFYTKATSVMSDKLLEKQQVVLDELNTVFDLKSSDKTAEDLTSLLNNVNPDSLTPAQKHTIEQLAPQMAGLTILSGKTVAAAVNCGFACKAGYEKIQDDKMLLLKHGGALLGGWQDMQNIGSNFAPALSGFEMVQQRVDNLSQAAGLAPVTPAQANASAAVIAEDINPDADYS